jgi:DNA adenine methylase
MRYQGGKELIAKRIAAVLEGYRKPKQLYIEPFVGSAAVVSRMTGNRVAMDANTDLIAFWQAIQQGWEPPSKVSRELYEYINRRRSILDNAPALRGFIAAFCSFGGKWWAGYAEENGRNFAAEGSTSIERIAPMINSVLFIAQDYRLLKPHGALIYCDPPYMGTIPYPGAPPFYHDEFWETMRGWAKTNTVLVSEYDALDGFTTCVWARNKTVTIQSVAFSRAITSLPITPPEPKRSE